ncbi:MAG: metal ABC transporter permease [Clostridiales bacterium]|nr:metal ABC transporter permease [Clostridiales bacterium]MCF8021844.1 metal ABC transporter permease [Clostridiales bacterium]
MEALQYEFMRNALAAGILASIACGIVGSYVVVKRIVFISGGVSHSAYGGIGLGCLFDFNPVLGSTLFSLAAALIIGVVSKESSQREDTVIGVIWAIGMSLGIIFISMSPGYSANLFSYLFGNILTVPTSDIFIMLVLDSLIITVVFLLYNHFLALCFDEEFALLVSYPQKLYLLLLCLIALTVVILIRVVGVILVIAMLTIPAAIGAQFTNNLKKMMFISTILGIIFTTVGLSISYIFNIASGATIILFSGITYLISIGVSFLWQRRNFSCNKL